ncbi:MAG: 2,3-bisphosphoglycerate-independent phosphoglycerate mutase [Saprospiraceae bacterium]|nr:2,3-bisphosphoglycerate-independent phosphoglycerate mutase [Saprospiraceae bacterium]
MNKKMMLLILDGWGIGPIKERSAIAMANTPNFNALMAKYPNATLLTHGENVGLPEGQMGNSEVGHINIGAGRVIYQELARINKAVREGELHANPLLHEALREAVKRNASIHLMGLVSDGGVHSHIDHLMALCTLCQDMEIPNTFVHAFLDGRDTDPKSGLGYLTTLQEKIADSNVQLATAIGRYYAMDRDNRWERTKKAYDLLVYGEGSETTDLLADLQRSYDEGITDEFFEPHVAVTDNAARIKDQDLVIFFNFRTDRPRQLTRVLTQEPVEEYELYPLNIDMITFARYDETFEGIDVLFEKDTVTHSLGEVVADAGLSQLRIAETEKYPHVSFFFSGGREEAFDKESRILVPSPKVATYDLEPEMSAREITDKLIDFVEKNAPDFVCLNFANTDMVGHTGVFSAAIKAAETVDECLGKIIPMGLEKDYGFIIIADHGNSDYMINDDGSPNTAHTTNPVPVIYIANEAVGYSMQNGILADVAPTILYCMGLAPSKEMNGKVLLSK